MKKSTQNYLMLVLAVIAVQIGWPLLRGNPINLPSLGIWLILPLVLKIDKKGILQTLVGIFCSVIFLVLIYALFINGNQNGLVDWLSTIGITLFFGILALISFFDKRIARYVRNLNK
ncbi:MAG: hypothetical protein FWF59_01065 [Turicibacter sp.]|nr:hypothetical protein [Turicibacter sp.]